MMYRKKNAGFSLVELIVVVLIMSIITAGVAMSVSAFYNADARRVARNIAAVLSQARQKAMAMDENDSRQVYVSLYEQGGKYKARIRQQKNAGIPDEISTTELGNYKVNIELGKRDSSAGGADNKQLTGNEVLIYFKKNTGGIEKIQWSNSPVLDDSSYADGDKIRDIIISGASTYKVIIVRETGKCYLDED